MTMKFLRSELPLPLRFSTSLPFSDDDRRDFPWLADDRYYSIVDELKKGGRAIAYRGFVCNREGERLPGTPEIVLKLPNLNTDEYTADQIKEYLNRLSDEGGKEWELTRRRLYGCEYANPIFDFHVRHVTYLGELMPLSVTAQLFLDSALSLDDYLLTTSQRTAPYKSEKGIPFDNWSGMTDPAKWIELTRAIAVGLEDIHQRRVVHGDIWPPNVFIRVVEGRPTPIFIDFGEAFPIEPKGAPQQQRDHAYRAPERRDTQSIVTWKADVYSFGKLALYLAIGEEPILPRRFHGHERRELVRTKFAKRNPGICHDNPFIIDIICKCVSVDPVDRPSIGDVVRALETYVDTRSAVSRVSDVSGSVAGLAARWQQVNEELAAKKATVGPFLEDLVEQRIDDIDRMMRGLANDVINLTDTRERIVVALIALFQRLGAGDRYLSLTNPRMWQGTALGLDGRYFTATELAAARGASIQRAFIISIQELGEAWTTSLCENLDRLAARGQYPGAAKLALLFRAEINRYLAGRAQSEVADLPRHLQKDAQDRLRLVIGSYVRARQGLCGHVFGRTDEFGASASYEGLYVGLIPVSTLSAMRTLKSAHPVSVFYYGHADERDRYLLMMTDCVGRTSYGTSDDSNLDDVAFQGSRPELRGITVFKSVLGIPEDRIRKLEQLFRQSVGVINWIDDFHEALPPAEPALAAERAAASTIKPS